MTYAKKMKPNVIMYLSVDGGLKQYTEFLNRNRDVVNHEIIYSEGYESNIQVEVACQYNDGYNPNIYTFCNNINTAEGGTHEEGFRLALNRVINKYARDTGFLKEKDDNLTTDDCREGLTAVMSVKLPDLLNMKDRQRQN